jgi:hypothetical protein
MQTSQFEGKKIALKQTKDGYAMTIAIHPDEVPDELLRDFVGARYMVVMVRLADNEEPLNREEYAGGQLLKKAGMICRDPEFWKFMQDEGLVFEMKESAVAEAVCGYCDMVSRSELKTSPDAQMLFKRLMGEFEAWKQTRST